MKKIFYMITLVVTTLLTACQGYNERNFPGFDENVPPKNLVQYEYKLTNADYTLIGNIINKPINDSIAAEKAKLKTAKTKEDSLAINTELKKLDLRLTTDSTYIRGAQIATNKYFSKGLSAAKYIPLLLNQKYIYTDPKSSVKVTYDFVDGVDTAYITADKKFTLADQDYIDMGTAANQPGQYKNFSVQMPTTTYLNVYLKKKLPYALKDEKSLVRYTYYDGKAAVKQYRVFNFDGKNWNSDKTSQFLFTKNKGWKYDPTIFIDQTAKDRSKDADGLPADMTNLFSVIVHHVWNNPELKKYVSSYKNDEYYYGSSAYQGNFSFQYTTREGKPYSDPELAALTNEKDKIELMFKRVNEAIIIYLEKVYPDTKAQTSEGLDQNIAVTFKAYERYPSGTNTNTYQATFQCVSSNPAKFKFIERIKL